MSHIWHNIGNGLSFIRRQANACIDLLPVCAVKTHVNSLRPSDAYMRQ